jgi:Trk-type K+ transport system membrane component
LLIKNAGSLEAQQKKKRLAPVFRAAIEVSFIIFLFYSNLLMGEYTNSGNGQHKGLWWAIQDIFTGINFIMAVTLAIIGHLGFEFVRRRM